jgi:hypothetical protein
MIIVEWDEELNSSLIVHPDAQIASLGVNILGTEIFGLSS